MDKLQKKVLFYVILGIIIAVNLIMISALFAHFSGFRSASEIGFLLCVFTTEILGWTTVGWRTALGYDLKADAAGNPEKEQPVVVQSTVYEDRGHPDVILKNHGREFLEIAQTIRLTPQIRIGYARQAKEIFAQINKNSPAYHSARYNIATCERICGNFKEAINLYLKVKKLVLASEQYTKDEARQWEADIEMMIGNVWEEQGTPQKARCHYFKAYTIYPDNILHVRNLFDLAIATKNLAEAMRWKELLASRAEYPSFSEQVEAKLRKLMEECEQNRQDESEQNQMDESEQNQMDE